MAGEARRKPSEQGSARKAPRADAARPLRTALRPPNPRGFFDRLRRAARFSGGSPYGWRGAGRSAGGRRGRIAPTKQGPSAPALVVRRGGPLARPFRAFPSPLAPTLRSPGQPGKGRPLASRRRFPCGIWTRGRQIRAARSAGYGPPNPRGFDRGRGPLPPPFGGAARPRKTPPPPAPRPPALALGTDHLGAAMPAGKKNKKEH